MRAANRRGMYLLRKFTSGVTKNATAIASRSRTIAWTNMPMIEKAAHNRMPMQMTTIRISRTRCQFTRSIRFCLGSIKLYYLSCYFGRYKSKAQADTLFSIRPTILYKKRAISPVLKQQKLLLYSETIRGTATSCYIDGSVMLKRD